MNYINLIKKIIISLSVILTFAAQADTNKMIEFNKLFKSGSYAKAIEELQKMSSEILSKGEKFYLLGLCNSKLQEYDNAILHFKLAIESKSKNQDIYYELGQALYAANSMREARQAFEQSIAIKFNISASLYYVAHISQIIEDLDKAKETFSIIISRIDSDEKVIQVSKFQLGETLLLLMREKNLPQNEQEKYVENEILTKLNQALAMDRKAAVAGEITQRIQQLMKEFNLDPDLLANGKRISTKRYTGYALQKIKFDDNVTYTNEENNILSSKKESYVFESEAYGKYDFILKKRLIISPEIRINYVQNGDQNNSDVFQNDSFLYAVNLKNKLEHSMFKLPASLGLDLEYSSTQKDWKKIHQRSAYAKTFSYGLSERFTFFKIGDTSFKIKNKSFKAENPLLSNSTLSISIDQSASVFGQHLLIAFFEADVVDNFNNPTTNTNTYLTRLDYIIPELFPKYTLDIAFSTTFTDTLKQKSARGTEVTINPSIDLSREINENLKFSINYDYSKNKSKQSDYAYGKNAISTEFRLSF